MPHSEPLMHVVIFGRPGSGKSSLTERLGAEHGFILIRTGELLREAVRRRDPIGVRVEQVLKAGELVPDPLIGALLEQSIEAPVTSRLLFDGFPRTMEQVPLLEQFEQTLDFRISWYLEIAVRREVAVVRMSGRRVCPVCGATYHVINQPPRVAEHCDRDGARLERRRDDTPEVIEVRQRAFDDHVQPILAYYRAHAPNRCRIVNGEQSLEDVYAETCRTLGLGASEPRGAP